MIKTTRRSLKWKSLVRVLVYKGGTKFFAVKSARLRTRKVFRWFSGNINRNSVVLRFKLFKCEVQWILVQPTRTWAENAASNLDCFVLYCISYTWLIILLFLYFPVSVSFPVSFFIKLFFLHLTHCCAIFDLARRRFSFQFNRWIERFSIYAKRWEKAHLEKLVVSSNNILEKLLIEQYSLTAPI